VPYVQGEQSVIRALACSVMLRYVTIMTKGDGKSCSPRRSVLTAARRSLPSKCPAVSLYRRTCKCIYVHKKRTAFPRPVVPTLTDAQQHHAPICYTDFRPNRTRAWGVWAENVVTTE